MTNLTPTMRKALEALEASDDYTPSWNIPGPITVLDRLCQNRLVELRDRTMLTQPTKARITEAGRQALASIRAAEVAKEAAVKTRPLSEMEMGCLHDIALQDSCSKGDRVWRGYGTIIVNKLTVRGFLKKIDADTVKITDAGRDALAKIKEAAR